MKRAIAVIFTVFCGCVSKEQSLPVFRYSGTVRVQPVENPPFVGIPISLEYFDGRLFISDYHGDTLVTEFDVGNSRVVSKSIIKGTGPGNALSPLTLFLSNDTLFLFNKQIFTLGYDLPDTSGEHRRLSFHKLCQFPNAISNLTAIEGRYLAAGYFDGGRYAVFNSRGEKEQEFGDYPSFLAGEKDFPMPAKAMYHQVSFAVSRKLHRVACVSTHVLDIVDYSASPNVVKQIQLDSYNYKFTTGNVSSNRTDDTSVGAIAVSSTVDYIYILFNPATAESVNAGSARANEIWCFDWNGEPVKKYPVDQPIYELKAVNDSILYSMSWPEYELVQLNLCETDLM